MAEGELQQQVERGGVFAAGGVKSWYNLCMLNQQHVLAQNLIRNNPSLVWYTKSYDELPIESIAEAVFNYGSWQEFLKLKEILGTNNLAQVFTKLDKMPRNNLLPIYRNYFRHYFEHYA